jgi:hypothetical protein
LQQNKLHFYGDFLGTVSMSSTGGSSGGGSSMTSIIGHFNNIALHTIAMSLSAVDNALMQYVAAKAGSSRLGSGSSIETINHPLPRSLNTKTNDAVNSAALTGRRDEP